MTGGDEEAAVGPAMRGAAMRGPARETGVGGGLMRRALNAPRPARVRTDAMGAPVEVDGRAVELVRESWLVEDRWWTARPLRRRYWEVLSAGGHNMVVFHDLGAAGPLVAGHGAREEVARRRTSGGWFSQGA
jgi:hypothetical protein